MRWFKLAKKISVVTGSRADYGLLKKLIRLIKDDPTMKLEIIATGSHFSSAHGNTFKEIELDENRIDHKVKIFDGFLDEIQTIESMCKCQFEIAKILKLNKPELLLILGDRYEILAAAISALILNIPIAHIHGGEITNGAFDDSIRHAITKLSFLHFVSTENSKRRVIQMGESPLNVFNVGGLGVDALKDLDLVEKAKLEEQIGFKFGEKNLIVTFHPETNSAMAPGQQISELLDALEQTKGINFIFTGVNADPGGQVIASAINNFVTSRPNSVLIPSMGQENYFSSILYSDGVIGNSSSGLLEVPSFKKATINIGKRQSGRELADSVLSCELESEKILGLINKIYTEEFQLRLQKTENPYGNEGASLKIYNILKELPLISMTDKKFFDLTT